MPSILSLHAGLEPQYEEIWRADGHDNKIVTALAFTPEIEGLPALSNGHSGWLVSSSKNLMVLWECIADEGEIALQVLQKTDHFISSRLTLLSERFWMSLIALFWKDFPLSNNAPRNLCSFNKFGDQSSISRFDLVL